MWRRSALGDLFDMFGEMESLFRQPSIKGSRRLLGGGTDRELATAGWTFSPAVDSYTKDGQLFIKAELPGVDPSAVQVTVTGNLLQISGEKKTSHEEEKEGVFYRETSHGRFERAFMLPEGVKQEEIKARFENGVLELSVPMPEQDRTRKILIEGAGSPQKVKAA